jgi:hypothetical protein
MQNHRIAMFNYNPGGEATYGLPFMASESAVGFSGNLYGALSENGLGIIRVAVETRVASVSLYYCIKY